MTHGPATPTAAAQAHQVGATGSSSAARPGTVVRDLAVLLGLLALATLTRLPDLATRGTWDTDQGNHMLTLRAMAHDGVIPLVGPPAAGAAFHHGALYDYVLAPAAVLTGGDSPFAVALEIALLAVVAVGITWALGRSIGGPVAGLVAGLLMAVSSSAVSESISIWNPNLVAFSSALALAGAWRAWRTRRARWWLVAALGTGLTIQFHLMGVTLAPIIGALLIADLRRRPDGPERRTVGLALLASIAVVALGFIPLLVHELTTDFGEVRAIVAYLQVGGEVASTALPVRVVVLLIRTLSWPLAGLITDAPYVAILAAMLVGGIVAWRWRSPDPAERVATRWFGLGIVWTALFLSAVVPSVATVVPGLPNDHYHAFADPMVFVLVGLGAAAGWRTAGGLDPAGVARTPARALVSVVVVAVVAWNVTHLPPSVSPDGGFPAIAAAAARIEAAADGRAIAVRSLPSFKPPEAIVYPLVRDGHPPVPESDASAVVITCDGLFATAIGAACGGPAEDAAVATEPLPAGASLVDRFPVFAPSGRQVISVYVVP